MTAALPPILLFPLGDMSPRHAPNSKCNRPKRHAIFLRQCLHQDASCMIALANEPDVCLRQLRHTMSCPYQVPRVPSALGHHIKGVLDASSEKQVVRSDAPAIRGITWGVHDIAAMAYLDALGDRAVSELPGHTMSALPKEATDRKAGVPAAVYGFLPKPTPIALLYPRPKTLSRPGQSCIPPIGVVADLAAMEARASMQERGWCEVKGFATANTDGVKGDRMRRHRKLTPFGVRPSAVSAARGLSMWLMQL